MQSYDSSDDENTGDNVQQKKSKARRSLESQFSAASEQQRSIENNVEESIPLQAGTEVCISEPTSSDSNENTRFPVRTPSFYAAMSESSTSIDLDPGWHSSECRMLEDEPKKKSKTSMRSVQTLPSTPHTPVPKQTSTPGSGQGTYTDVRISMSSDSIPICRICHEGSTQESLLSPCYCTGSVGMLHLSCLEKWLGTSNTTRCEICKYEFKVRRKPRSFLDFVRHSRSGNERKNLICDIVCFFVLTPLTLLSAYLCLNGVKYYSKWSDRWEVPGLICLTISLLIIFLIWCIIAVRHHMQILLHWRKQNQVIKIIYLSPVKGNAVINTSPVLDRNENHIQPPPNWQNHTNSRQQTPSQASRSYNVMVSVTPSNVDASTSYRAAMLKPILRYSTNVETFACRSELESTASMVHTVTWGSNGNSISVTSPLMKMSSDGSQCSRVCKETYI